MRTRLAGALFLLFAAHRVDDAAAQTLPTTNRAPAQRAQVPLTSTTRQPIRPSTASTPTTSTPTTSTPTTTPTSSPPTSEITPPVPPQPCANVVLTKFHAVNGYNPISGNIAGSNRSLSFPMDTGLTFEGTFTSTRTAGVGHADVTVQIPDAYLYWSFVQLTFSAGASQRKLRPYDPALTQLTPSQAQSLGYKATSDGRGTCFIKLYVVERNTPFILGASAYAMGEGKLTFVDRSEISISPPAQPASGPPTRPDSPQYSGRSLLSFGEGRVQSYHVELWYFDDQGAFKQDSSFLITLAKCLNPLQKDRHFGTYLPKCYVKPPVSDRYMRSGIPGAQR